MMLQIPSNPRHPANLPATPSITDAGNDKSASEIQAQK